MHESSAAEVSFQFTGGVLPVQGCACMLISLFPITRLVSMIFAQATRLIMFIYLLNLVLVTYYVHGWSPVNIGNAVYTRY